MPKYTKVTLTGPKERVAGALTELLEGFGTETHSAVLAVQGNGPDDNALLELIDDDYGEGAEAPLLATVEEKEE